MSPTDSSKDDKDVSDTEQTPEPFRDTVDHDADHDANDDGDAQDAGADDADDGHDTGDDSDGTPKGSDDAQ